MRQEKRKVGRILLLMEEAGQLLGLRLWAAQRRMASEGRRREGARAVALSVEDCVGGQGAGKAEGSGSARSLKATCYKQIQCDFFETR